MKNLFGLMGLLFICSCSNPPEYMPERSYLEDEKNLLAKFIMAEDSSVIELDEGHYLLNKSLIMEGKSHVTIKGKGIDKTVISFKNQEEGAEGMRFANCTNIIIQDLSVEDAAGDNIKVTDSKGVTLRNIKSAWTGAVTKDNGAYGLYPVLCSDVLVENCEVLGANDAGIYVGQSRGVVIRNNKVYWNVAGIESENSTDVEIYGNEAFDNTGGLLVFDLPGLTMYGSDIKVYNNRIASNNLKNFAPSGNIVGMVPPGTGILVLATKNVDVYDNEIVNNRTVGVGIISYVLVDAMGNAEEDTTEAPLQGIQADYTKDKNYDPYPGNISVRNNEYKNAYWFPSLDNDFGKLFLMKFGMDIPEVIWDGIKSPSFLTKDEYKICVSEGEGISTASLDAENDFAGLERNPKILQCDKN